MKEKVLCDLRPEETIRYSELVVRENFVEEKTNCDKVGHSRKFVSSLREKWLTLIKLYLFSRPIKIFFIVLNYV